MVGWYRKVTNDPNDLSPVVDAIDHFEAVYQDGRRELDVNEKPVAKIAARLPGLVEYYHEQWREITAILEYIELRAEKQHSVAKRAYLENYAKALTDRTADNYANTDEDVQMLRQLAIEVRLVRDKFAGLSKGFEYLHFQLTNIRALRVAQMEDALI